VSSGGNDCAWNGAVGSTYFLVPRDYLSCDGALIDVPYTTPCNCGRRLPVAAVEAGSLKRCECGREVVVPPMSKLRTAAGEDPRPLNTLETISRAIAEGRPPIDDVCLISGRRTQQRLWVRIECERRWRKTDHADNWVLRLLGVLFGGFEYLILARSVPAAEEPREFGRETWIDVPLPIHEQHHPAFRRYGAGKLKPLLREVPLYAKLLDEYPEAEVRAT
jgi:hypothetical protein